MRKINLNTPYGEYLGQGVWSQCRSLSILTIRLDNRISADITERDAQCGWKSCWKSWPQMSVDGHGSEVIRKWLRPRWERGGSHFTLPLQREREREWMGIEPTKPLFRGFTGFEAQDGHQIRVHSRRD